MTIQLHVPNDDAFARLKDVKELPESTLEIAETRIIHDIYLDTASHSLMDKEMDLRLSTVNDHRFLIFNEVQRPGKLLKGNVEHVERLSEEEFEGILSGDRTHPLFEIVKKYTDEEIKQIVSRTSTFISKLIKVGETRFELGLESIDYDQNGKLAEDRLLSLDLIQGEVEVLDAMALYLKDEFELEFVKEPLVFRALKFTA